MKVHVGCGKHVLDGWINCDIQRNPLASRDPELLCDARTLRLPNECADVLMANHVLENFYAWEAPFVLSEWGRVLKRGGVLILELPNIEAAARNLLAGLGDQMSMWPLYGDPGHQDPYMCHKWGYTPKTLQDLLLDNGFINPVMMNPQTHGRRKNRDMRCEAIRA